MPKTQRSIEEAGLSKWPRHVSAFKITMLKVHSLAVLQDNIANRGYNRLPRASIRQQIQEILTRGYRHGSRITERISSPGAVDVALLQNSPDPHHRAWVDRYECQRTPFHAGDKDRDKFIQQRYE